MTKAQKKERVLRAATECFAKYGYEKTTLDDIGAVVGLNKASLYYYYKNKESLFCDVIFREAEIFMGELQSKISYKSNAENKIMEYLGERINYYQGVVNLHNLSIDTIRKVEPVFIEVYDQVLAKEADFISSLIKEGVFSGEFKKNESDIIAKSILAVATGIRYREVHISMVKKANDADYSKIIEEIKFITKLIIDGIRI